MTETFRTYGEALLQRRLETERRQGVEHYVPGQAEVEIERDFDEETGAEVYLATYGFVDQMGAAVCMVFARDKEHWVPVAALRAGLLTPARSTPIPDCFVPSDKMLKRLNDKLEEVRRR